MLTVSLQGKTSLWYQRVRDSLSCCNNLLNSFMDFLKTMNVNNEIRGCLTFLWSNPQLLITITCQSS